MKNYIILSLLLINSAVFSQDISVQDGKYLFQETYYNPDGFPESYPGAIELYNGNINILAPGAPFTPSIGILSVQKDGQIGFNTIAAEAGLHLKQDSSHVAGTRGLRLQNNKGNHWTIEINETDNEIDLFYNGTRKASIKTDGTYYKASTSLFMKDNGSKINDSPNTQNQNENLNSRMIIHHKTIQSLEEKIKSLEERISSLAN